METGSLELGASGTGGILADVIDVIVKIWKF
jgi:hypothetical protein